MSEFMDGFVAGSGNDNSGFGGNGSWIWIILVFALLGWGGNGFVGGGGAGAATNYVLSSDFATIQRQLSDGFGSIDNALDRQNAGICDLGYTQAQLIAGVNQNISQGFANSNMAMMQGFNGVQAGQTALGNQLAQCCCDNKQLLADLKYTMATENRDAIEATNNGTRAILDALAAQQTAALQDKIASLTADNQALKFSASQWQQNNYLIGQLRPAPIPAYPVANPYCYTNNSGCGCGV